MIIIASTPQEKQKLAKIALKSKMYLDNGFFRDFLIDLSCGNADHEIGLYFINNNPVCASILCKDGLIGFYTLPEYRHKGYASQLSTEMRNKFNNITLWSCEGDSGTKLFFEKIGINETNWNNYYNNYFMK